MKRTRSGCEQNAFGKICANFTAFGGLFALCTVADYSMLFPQPAGVRLFHGMQLPIQCVHGVQHSQRKRRFE